jgi:hypothetical protein
MTAWIVGGVTGRWLLGMELVGDAVVPEIRKSYKHRKPANSLKPLDFRQSRIRLKQLQPRIATRRLRLGIPGLLANGAASSASPRYLLFSPHASSS